MSSDESRPDSDLIAAVRAAASEGELEQADHEAILALALGDEVSEFDDEEREQAECLRAALAGQGSHPLAELAESLRCAASPQDVDELANERLIRMALRRAAMRDEQVAAGGLRLGLVMGGVAAAAAALLVFFQPKPSDGPTQRSVPSLVVSHSTTALFETGEPFARRGGESKRIDRIAAARERQLRANRFAHWGVR